MGERLSTDDLLRVGRRVIAEEAAGLKCLADAGGVLCRDGQPDRVAARAPGGHRPGQERPDRPQGGGHADQHRHGGHLHAPGGGHARGHRPGQSRRCAAGLFQERQHRRTRAVRPALSEPGRRGHRDATSAPRRMAELATPRRAHARPVRGLPDEPGPDDQHRDDALAWGMPWR